MKKSFVKGYLWRSLKSPVPIPIGMPMIIHSLTPTNKRIGQYQNIYNHVDIHMHLLMNKYSLVHLVGLPLIASLCPWYAASNR